MIAIVDFAIRKGSMKGYPAFLRIVLLTFLRIYFLSEALFLRLMSVFMTRLDFSHGTSNVAEIGQAVVDLKLGVK